MSYKYYRGTVYEVYLNRKIYYFSCYTQNTRYGYRHVCFNIATDKPKEAGKPFVKICHKANDNDIDFCYKNTLRKAINKLNESAEIKEILINDVVIRPKDKPRKAKVDVMYISKEDCN